jgi:two-component SAPR family response regulator
MRILILEDTRAIACSLSNVIGMIFVNRQLSIRIAATTEEAKSLLATTDLLISDYNLLNETTAEFLDRDVAGKVPFVVFSASEEFAFSARVLEHVLAIIEKPVDINRLRPILCPIVDSICEAE